MKNLIKLTCLLLFATTLSGFKKLVYAGRNNTLIIQTRDTVKLLNDNVTAHKSNFVGKPLNQLLPHLPKVKAYVKLVDDLRIRRPINSIILYFYEPGKVRKYNFHSKEVPFIIITFQNPVSPDIPASKSVSGVSYWGDEEISYYGDLLIKDVIVLRRVGRLKN